MWLASVPVLGFGLLGFSSGAACVMGFEGLFRSSSPMLRVGFWVLSRTGTCFATGPVGIRILMVTRYVGSK